MNHKNSNMNGQYHGNAPPPPPPPPPSSSKGPSANGLIRLSLKKPMGIVFEPMEDPHNAAQQRGVRICELPKSGAAAMSNLLEVGDELLSINNKPMARLTFDEIMDFIIDVDAGNVDLLFRRPKKETLAPKTSSQVKWDSNVVQAELVPIDDEGTVDDTVDDTVEYDRRRNSPRIVRGANSREEESILSQDDTFYTEQTSYTEDTRDVKKRSKGRNRRYQAESFLDMLIDTMCAPVMGKERSRRGDDSDDDMTYDDEMTYDDDYTFLQMKKKKWQESRKKITEKDKKLAAEEERKNRKSKSNDSPISKKSPSDHTSKGKPKSSPTQIKIQSRSVEYDHTYSAEDEYGSKPNQMHFIDQNKPSSPQHIPFKSHEVHEPKKASSRFNPITKAERFPGEEEDDDHFQMDNKIPFKEITYDDHDDGAEVSVMESVGGPSLLLENLHNIQTVKKTVKPELIAAYGKDFKPEMGLTREESIQLYPIKFYKHVVTKLLTEYEPDKVRLLDKLFAKYEGREEHLIEKLDSRYAAESKEPTKDSVAGNSKSMDDSADYLAFKTFNATSALETDDDNAWTPSADFPAFQSSHDNAIGNDGSEGTGSVSGSDDSGDYESIDGTSPEVIAQVSELLNYVYGKTTVAGQIDRVSTIMRAYEGREAILLELLETKALMKANNEKDGQENLPDFLRNNPEFQKNINVVTASSPTSKPSATPASPMNKTPITQPMKSPMGNISNTVNGNVSSPQNSTGGDNTSPDGKKKKGLFKKMFSKRENKSGKGAFPSDNGSKRSKGIRKGLLVDN